MRLQSSRLQQDHLAWQGWSLNWDLKSYGSPLRLSESGLWFHSLPLNGTQGTLLRSHTADEFLFYLNEDSRRIDGLYQFYKSYSGITKNKIFKDESFGKKEVGIKKKVESFR